MHGTIIAALVLLFATTAHAQVTPSSLTFGSTFPSEKALDITATGPFTVAVPPWLLPSQTSGEAPARILLRADKSQLAANVTTKATVVVTVAGVDYAVLVQGKCSTSSGCGTGPPILPPPTERPTSVRTATPLPGQPTPTRTVFPTGGITATATGGKTATPTRTATPIVPTAEPTSVPPSGYLAQPMRPTGLDVSYRVLDEGAPFRWCMLRRPPGGSPFGYVPCTQVGMDAMTETSLVAIVNLVRVVRGIENGWAGLADFMLSESQGASAITAFLNPIYEGNFGDYRGDWAEDENGKDYSKPFYVARKARAFLLNHATACAAAPEIGKFLDFLNLTISAGRCVDSGWRPVFPATKVPNATQALGTIDYDTKQPPLLGAQLHLLHMTHAQHRAVSDWRCGVGPQPAPGVVAQAHLALEASARNETELHFFGLKAFSGDVDPRWSPAEECKWARLQDADHERWMRAVEAGDWAASRKAETSHQNAHFCMNLRDERLKIRRPDCGAANASQCPVLTCGQVLAGLP